MFAATRTPELHSVEEWALHFVQSTELRTKVEPPPVPALWESSRAPLRIEQPGRPSELSSPVRRKRTTSVRSLSQPEARARLLHSFWHHELQAAELMCWAILAFPSSEPDFKKGLLGICRDEIRHMGSYQRHIESLGFGLASFGVRDWFWQRVPSCPTALSFVSLMGMGLEAANLEHAPSFAEMFDVVGDVEGAAIQRKIAEEELSHVAFGIHWFRRWTGACDFEEWARQLPPPLSPWVLRGPKLATEARLRAGMSPEFIAQLAAYVPEPRGAQLGSRPPGDGADETEG